MCKAGYCISLDTRDMARVHLRVEHTMDFITAPLLSNNVSQACCWFVCVFFAVWVQTGTGLGNETVNFTQRTRHLLRGVANSVTFLFVAAQHNI